MLDILIPTKRWNAYTRAFLSYMANVVTHSQQELQLYIGDNSCDADKHRFLKSLKNERVHVFLHETDVGANGNFKFLMENSSAPNMQIFGDDDWIHADWYDNLHYLDDMPELSGVMGSFVCYPAQGKQTTQPGDRFCQPDAVARARDYILYMLNEVGVNTFAFILGRRKDYEIFYSYMEKHPGVYQFHDQLLSQVCLLRGPVKCVNNGLIVYNQKIDAVSSGPNTNRWYVDSGLPEWIGNFQLYLWGVEYATLYQFRELSDDIFQNRVEAANQIFLLFFSAYQPSQEFVLLLKDAGLLHYLEEVYANPTAEQGVFNMHKIVSKLNPEFGEKYAYFLNTYTNFKV